MKRRDLLGGLIAGLAVGGAARKAHGDAKLRPPGAENHDAFTAKCIRCFRCAEACPVEAIRFDASATPFVVARDRGCVLCMACTTACPTGALERIEPVHVKMGVAVVDEKKCIAWQASGVCRACYYVCPYQDAAITLRGPMQAPHIDARDCVGCGLCEEACPERARAIKVKPA